MRTLLLAAVLMMTPFTAFAHDAHAGAWSLELVGEDGQVLPTFSHRGRTYVLGARGQRYDVRIRNRSGDRIEAVVSVDGRDVLDGQTASPHKRGYLVEAYGETRIDGFRLNSSSVAAFRFSSVADSYAAKMGNARDVGVIGVAIFKERPPQPVYRSYSAEPLAGNDSAERKAEAAPSSPPSSLGGAPAKGRAMPAPTERPGLGTEFGEQRSSYVSSSAFERLSEYPSALLTLRYNDRAGLLALGIDVDGRRPRYDDYSLRESAQPFRGYPGFSQPPPGWRP